MGGQWVFVFSVGASEGRELARLIGLCAAVVYVAANVNGSLANTTEVSASKNL